MASEKGLVLSLSTLLIVIVLVWFAAFYSEKVARSEEAIYRTFAIEKARFVADDLVWDVNRLLGASVSVNRGQSFTTITVSDRLPGDINKLQLIDYNQFIDRNYSGMQNASISLNLESLVDGNTEMLFSNGLQYDHQYKGDQNFVRFYRGDGLDTDVLTYDVNIFVRNARYDSGSSVAWSCDNDGDVNVNLRYSDSYGESVESLCQQHSNQEYEYEFDFQEIEGSLVVSFGNVQGNANSVKVRDNIANESVSVSVSLGAVMPSPSEEIAWYYDADLNYSQQQVQLNRKLELGRA